MKTRIVSTTVTIIMVLGLLAASSPLASAIETYEVDPEHSAIVFRIKHLGITYVYGRFNDMSGTLKIDDQTPANSSVQISAKAANVDTAVAERDDHLRNPDFFDAKKFQTISFSSKSFKKLDQDAYEVAGALNLHGITRPLTVNVQHTGSGKDPWGGYRTGYETTFTIKRSDFGMTTMLNGVGDEVRITVSIEGVRK
ncbi:MAG: YceI family protein [Deltaproteobacteria bacterium]|nr:YceI family protein [Deltaproteobacteria bacterium]